MQLIPAIDLRQGNVVRLTQGDDARRTLYDVDPKVMLRRFADAGISLVHVVDLDAAFGDPPQRRLIAELARIGPGLEMGGGLRDREAVEWALGASGAACHRVVIGSLVARDFDAFRAIAEAFPNRVVPAVEVADGELRIAGWRESATVTLERVCDQLQGLPCPAVLVTDVERDGMLQGPNLELADRVARLSGLPALLSGGVRSLTDLEQAARFPRIAGAIVGKALYDGVLTVEQALAACQEDGQSETRQSVTGQSATGLTCRIIPCLDVQAGRVVKGVKFQNLRDQGDPAESAARYDHQGADELVFLDITAAPERRDTDLDWVRRTAEQVFIPLTVGGGVRQVDDARRLLHAGADKVAINTAALENPDLLSQLARQFGSQCVVLSVDAKRRGDDEWEVVTHGGRRPRGRGAVDWILEGIQRGAGEILLTSIDADGTRNGYDLDLLHRVSSQVNVPLIASGGAGKPEHLAAALRAGAAAVLAASIFHQGTYTVGQVKRLLADQGFPMRQEME